MYKDCKSEQSAARQRELENGLLELMKKSRYENISVSDLCEHMNIPRKSFYRYFSSKEGALFALLDHSLLDFYDMPDPEHKGGTAIGDLERYFRFWYQKRGLLEALQHSGLSGILVERSMSLAVREQLMPRKMTHWDKKQQTVAMTFAVCGLMSMVFQWQEQGYQLSPGEMANIATTILTQPLLCID